MKAIIKQDKAIDKRQWHIELTHIQSQKWEVTVWVKVPGEWVEFNVVYLTPEGNDALLTLDEIVTKDLQKGFYGITFREGGGSATAIWEVVDVRNGNEFLVKFTPLRYPATHTLIQVSVYNSEMKELITPVVEEKPPIIQPDPPVVNPGVETVIVKDARNLRDSLVSDKPLIVQFSGEIKGEGSLYVRSNKQVKGVDKAILTGIGLYVFDPQAKKITENVLLSNFTIRNVRLLTPESDNDCVNVKNGSRNINLEHLEIYNDRISDDWEYYEGLVDITRSCTDVEIAWCRLHDTHKGMLFNNPANEPNPPEMRIVMHHNHIFNISERAPNISSSTGRLYIYNNLFEDIGTTISALEGAHAYVQANYFLRCYKPLETKSKDRPVGWIGGVESNIFDSCQRSIIRSPRSPWTPSMAKDVLPADQVPDIVRANAGPKQ